MTLMNDKTAEQSQDQPSVREVSDYQVRGEQEVEWIIKKKRDTFAYASSSTSRATNLGPHPTFSHFHSNSICIAHSTRTINPQ